MWERPGRSLRVITATGLLLWNRVPVADLLRLAPMPRTFDSPEPLASAIIDRIGSNIVLGLPVGLGKAVHVANALYERAVADPSLHLTIFTALTLEVPRAGSDLERRFLEPLADRLYKDWPGLAYAGAVSKQRLPKNIEVREFYFRPAAYLGNPAAQQSYTSLNYTQVAGALLELGVNVIGQLVACRDDDRSMLSLGANPEVTLDLLPALERRRANGTPVAIVGQVNDRMPYMFGDAELAPDCFDFLLDAPKYMFPMFGMPNRKVSHRDYATGMHVASLVADGGTLQLGIGSLSDAVAQCLILRHRSPELFRAVLQRLPGGAASARRPELPVHTGPFEKGLYVATELLSDAAFALYLEGIVNRGAGAGDDACLHAGFFIGSQALYEGLHALPESRRRRISMRAISFVNSLYGDEAVKRRQRVSASFVNEVMMVTLLGAAVSDGLEDGRVVSGVGGQFDFVRMAHALKAAHSVLIFGSHRMHDGKPRSNIVWNYGHTTVPRHYRDVFANEYGLAATRGLCDQDVIAALLEIADARFQPSLLEAARSAGKIRPEYAVPQEATHNTEAAINAVLGDPELAGHFPAYPLGTDLTATEQRLADALTWLKHHTATTGQRLSTMLSATLNGRPKGHDDALARMGLAKPANLRERLARRLLAHALNKEGR